MNAVEHAVWLLGEVKLRHLLAPFGLVLMLALVVVVGLTWYLPLWLIAWTGRRLGVWAWHPF